MYLYARDREGPERGVDRPAGVRPGGGIDDHPVDGVVRGVAPVDELALVVRLAALDGQLELAGPFVDSALELGDRQAAVERRIPSADDVQVHAVEDQHPHAINLSSSRRTSASAAKKSQRGPSSPSTTSRMWPSIAFLSRFIASHARSRSARTGSGRSTSSTTAVSRPEMRSAASSPRATARPWVS